VADLWCELVPTGRFPSNRAGTVCARVTVVPERTRGDAKAASEGVGLAVINSCVLVGRIASDPEMRYTTSGMAVTNFRLAVSRQRKSQDGQDDTDWLDIVAFAKSAEFVAQYLDKGSLVGA